MLTHFPGEARQVLWPFQGRKGEETEKHDDGELRERPGCSVRGCPDRGCPAGHTEAIQVPGGRAVLYTITPQGNPIENGQIAALNLATNEEKVLIQGAAIRTMQPPATSCMQLLENCGLPHSMKFGDRHGIHHLCRSADRASPAFKQHTDFPFLRCERRKREFLCRMWPAFHCALPPTPGDRDP